MKAQQKLLGIIGGAILLVLILWLLASASGKLAGVSGAGDVARQLAGEADKLWQGVGKLGQG